ncbi:hypothetical protein MJI12_24975, partial [Salmonella enterica subsp. enterica serovar Kentucky]|nr:hypothetical protein [Salmonella enterica subsp. enterica serovar Kentucky]
MAAQPACRPSWREAGTPYPPETPSEGVSMSEQQIDWDLALIQKYNYSGPRYTSYPTALEFSEDFEDAAFLQAVAR